MGNMELVHHQQWETLATYIENDVNDVNTLDLLTSDMPEETCDVLVIANPTSDFTT